MDAYIQNLVKACQFVLKILEETKFCASSHIISMEVYKGIIGMVIFLQSLCNVVLLLHSPFLWTPNDAL